MYFSMSKDRSSSTFSTSTLKDIVELLYDAFGESLVPYIRHEQPNGLLEMCL